MFIEEKNKKNTKKKLINNSPINMRMSKNHIKMH